MTARALLVMVITSSTLITRTVAALLQRAGISADSSRFQARVAFCGVGYAGRETEGMRNHRLRRPILSTLMLLGNAGTATVVAMLMLSFSAAETDLLLALCLRAGSVANRAWFDEHIRQFVPSAFRRCPRLEVHDDLSLLRRERGVSGLQVLIAAGD